MPLRPAALVTETDRSPRETVASDGLSMRLDAGSERAAALLLDRCYQAGLHRDPATYELIYHYPPARTFVPVEPEQIAHALRAHPPGPLLLYVHLPFANTRCSFCHYVCEPRATRLEMESYMGALSREISVYGACSFGERQDVDALHVGGGTPTCVPLDLLENMLRQLRTTFRFEKIRELSIEASPETITSSAYVTSLREMGFTRLSVGVQSMEDPVLREAGRAHNSEMATKAVEAAVTTGVRDLNVDLIYGLPWQTEPGWTSTVETIAASGVNSVCLYQLRVAPRPGAPSAGSPFGESDLLRMALAGDRILCAHGFRPVQPNQWVRSDGSYHRYVEGKWRRRIPMLGLGVSAYSSFDFATFVNTRVPRRYASYTSTADRTHPVHLWGPLDEERRLGQRLVLGWRNLDYPVDFSELAGAFPDQTARLLRYEETLAILARSGVFHRSGSLYRATRLALHRADEVSVLLYADADTQWLRDAAPRSYGAYLPWPASRQPGLD